MPTATKKERTRRTPEQMIADLEKQIREVKRKAQQRDARKNPTIRHVAAAVRSIDKALAATQDTATKKALSEVRATLAACQALGRGTLIPRPQAARVDPDRVLDYLAKHTGSRSEEIAAALGTETAGIRPALQKLSAGGRVRTEGHRSAMRYFV